jgi:D-Tyr-tRNAtyr deacylase
MQTAGRAIARALSRQADPEHAEELYDYIVEKCRAELGAEKIGTGAFGEHMTCSLVNQGPFTIILDSAEIMSK